MTKNKDANKVVKLKKKKESLQFDGVISKVKLKKDIPEIWFKINGERSTKDIKLTAKERPLDEFPATLQNLKNLLCDVCEIKDKFEYTTITGVSFSKKGVVIMGIYKLINNGIKCPVPINTPHIFFDSNGSGYEIPENEQEKIEEFKKAVIRYINGETAEKQTTLDFAEV